MKSRFSFSTLTLTLVPALATVLLDQGLKFWATAHLMPFERRFPLGQKWLALSRVLNRGLVGDRFSAIPDGSIEPYTRYGPTLVWLVLLVWCWRRARGARPVELLAMALLLAGGASNLVSHWISHNVVDPLQIYQGAGEYLPFNFADVALLSGALILTVALARALMSASTRVSADPLV